MANPRNISLGKGGARGNDSGKALSMQPIMYIGKVLEIDKVYASNRVRVYIEKFDKDLKNQPIPWCTPFLPLHLNIVPKKGEYVKVILYDSQNGESYREYIGPLVPQKGEFLNFSDETNSRRGREGYNLNFNTSPNVIPKAKNGLYPDETDIALQGRDNTDIIFKKSQVIIRAHKFLTDRPYEKNEKNPAYIQINTLNSVGSKLLDNQIEANKNSTKKIKLSDDKYNDTRTDINLVSNKIYLIGRDSSSSIIQPYFNDSEEENIEDKLHPIVYGDVLKEFIHKLFNWAKAHQHPYANLPQNREMNCFKDLENWMSKELPKLNSKNIFAGGDVESNKELENYKNANQGSLSTVDNPKPEGSINRINNLIRRSDEDNEPEFKVESRKVSDENGNHLVEMDITNPITGELLVSISGEGSNESLAYGIAVGNLVQKLKENGTKIKDIFKLIPPLQDIITN